VALHYISKSHGGADFEFGKALAHFAKNLVMPHSNRGLKNDATTPLLGCGSGSVVGSEPDSAIEPESSSMGSVMSSSSLSHSGSGLTRAGVACGAAGWAGAGGAAGWGAGGAAGWAGAGGGCAAARRAR